MKNALGEKGKVNIVAAVFSIVDQLLTRILGIKYLPNKKQIFDFVSSDILL